MAVSSQTKAVTGSSRSPEKGLVREDSRAPRSPRAPRSTDRFVRMADRLAALARARSRSRRRCNPSVVSKKFWPSYRPSRTSRGRCPCPSRTRASTRSRPPVDECKDKDMTYAAPLFVTAEFINNNTGEIKSQTVFMGDFPMMTDKGTFIINGTERVVVSPAGPLAGRLLRRHHRQDHREDPAQRQGHPGPRRVARVRRRQARHRRRTHRPQAPSAGHRAAEGTGLDHRADHRALRLLRDPHGDAGEGQHRQAPTRRCSTSTASCVRASRRPRRARRPCWRTCSSRTSATTWPAWAATRSTRSWA